MRVRKWLAAFTVLLLIEAGGGAPAARAYGGTFEEDLERQNRTEAMFEAQGMKSADTETPLPAPAKGTGSGSRPKEKAYGPGRAAEEAEKSEETQEAAAVKTVFLAETYHEDFEVYEENLEDVYFIYSSVENGGVTDQPVRLELPRNVTCEAQKDGEIFPYVSGQALGETGAYVMRLYAPSDPGMTGQAPVTYQALFRFRIQQRPVKETVRETEDEGLTGGAWGTRTQYSGLPQYADEGAEQTAEETESGELSGEAESGGDGETPKEAGADADREYMDEYGNYNGEAIRSLIGGGTDAESERTPAINRHTGLEETYVEELGLFRNTLLTGSYFYANVPNGMISNSAVTLELGEGMEAAVLKEGEPYEHEPGMAFSETGSYTVYLSEPGVDYMVSYSDRTAPQFHFRIIDGPVRDMELFNVPEALRLLSVSRDGQPVQSGGSYFRMERDGAYTAEMEDGMGGTWQTTVVKDTSGPEFTVGIEKDFAYLSYGSEDIERVVVTKDGESREVSLIHEIEGKGDYRIDVYDQAGNVSSAAFRLTYRFNRAAIAAILLLVAAAGAAVFFLVRTKKKIVVK